MVEFFGTFCVNAKILPRLNVGFKHLGMVNHLSVIVTLPDIFNLSRTIQNWEC